jgi:hypothetical protein
MTATQTAPATRTTELALFLINSIAVGEPGTCDLHDMSPVVLVTDDGHGVFEAQLACGCQTYDFERAGVTGRYGR